MLDKINIEEIISGKNKEWTLIELSEDDEERDKELDNLLWMLLFNK